VASWSGSSYWSQKWWDQWDIVIIIGGTTPIIISVFVLCLRSRFVAACYVKSKKGWVSTDSQHGLVPGGTVMKGPMDRIAGGDDGKDHALRLGRTPPFPKPCVCVFLPTTSRIWVSVTRIVTFPTALTRLACHSARSPSRRVLFKPRKSRVEARAQNREEERWKKRALE
jgi:hypothetical protein